MKRIIISGGNFINKGAEAMLFISAYECFSRYSGCVCVVQLPQGFAEVSSLEQLYELSKNGIPSSQNASKLNKLKKMIRVYREADLMIDISGYELCSKLGNYPSLRYLFKIALSKWMKTDVVLMPQSYGPFTYKGGLRIVIPQLIRRYMKYPLICFARERESAKLLKKSAPSAQIQLSSDLVLQNNTILRAVEPIVELPSIEIPKHSVAVVVNRRLYEQYGEKIIKESYHIIVSELLKRNKTVFLLCHAIDDLSICQETKSAFSENSAVMLVDTVLSCFAFEVMARSFDYIVSARYHSIVHAYKECTPCIALGWAVKYQELLEIMGQQEYLVQIASVNPKEMGAVINKMEASSKEERKRIALRLKKIQEKNCFDFLVDKVGM